jgi:hypothetical protein
MKIVKETPMPFVNLDCEFSQDEQDTLIAYAIKNMSKETLINLLLEWAFINILKKQIDETERQIKDKPVKKLKRKNK